MKYIMSLSLLVFLSCEHSGPASMFSELDGEEKVWLVLSNYGLDSIPPQIGTLKDAKELKISSDTSNQWVVYPPYGTDFWGKWSETPPFRYLPAEITELKQLRSLDLQSLDLRTLPDDFGQLSELEYLNLSMNKLDISKELPKLRQLNKLQELDIIGNKIDVIALESWQAERPDLKIIYRLEM